MELTAAAFDFTEDCVNALLCLMPVLSIDTGIYRVNEEAGFGEEELIVEQTSSGMIGVAADDGSVYPESKAICDFAGINGIFIGIGGRIFF